MKLISIIIACLTLASCAPNGMGYYQPYAYHPVYMPPITAYRMQPQQNAPLHCTTQYLGGGATSMNCY